MPALEVFTVALPFNSLLLTAIIATQRIVLLLCAPKASERVSHNPRRNFPMTTDRYQRGLDRMMELVSPEHSNTFDHAKLVESY